MGKITKWLERHDVNWSQVAANRAIVDFVNESKKQTHQEETSPQEDLFCALCQATGGVEKVMQVLVENLKKDLAKKEGMVQILDDYPDEQQKMREDIQNYQDLIRLHKEIMGNE